MKKVEKSYLKMIVSFVIVFCLALANQQILYAEEIDLEQEYFEKKEAGIEIYEIIDNEGNLMGYFEPNCVKEVNENARLGIKFDIGNWTIPGKTTSWTNRVHSLLKGDKITVNITQIQNGPNFPSYLVLRDNDNGTFAVINSSLTTNGWKNGTITVGYDGHFNFGIQNVSTQSITYVGTYSY